MYIHLIAKECTGVEGRGRHLGKLTCAWMDVHTHRWTDTQTDGYTDGRKHTRTDGYINGQTDTHTDGRKLEYLLVS